VFSQAFGFYGSKYVRRAKGGYLGVNLFCGQYVGSVSQGEQFLGESKRVSRGCVAQSPGDIVGEGNIGF